MSFALLSFFFLWASLFRGQKSPTPMIKKEFILLVPIFCFPYGPVGIQFKALGGADICLEAEKRIHIHRLFQSYFCLKPQVFGFFWDLENGMDIWNLDSKLKDFLAEKSHNFLVIIHKHLLLSHKDVPWSYLIYSF